MPTPPHPLDEYPIHQTPLSMNYVATSDRNFYDRWYFNAHDRTGEVFLITGAGAYANLGTTDAFATVRRGDVVTSVRFSDALGSERLQLNVGGYHLEVLEPLQRIRLVCDGDEHGVGFDLTWEGSFPAVEEQPHTVRMGPRITLQSTRFAQVGTWSGVLRVGGDETTIESPRWVGTRDRSWGIRPVGEGEAPGRYAAEAGERGFWWLYVPLRFEDFSIIVIAQEDPDGYRTLNDATRVWRDGRVEQLGWPRVEIAYRSGTRHPEGAVLHVTDSNNKPLAIEIETLGFVPLSFGSGYGDPTWSHGQWKGRGWVDGVSYDLSDPENAGRIGFGVIDHVARATCDGAEGWGLFEHTSIGRHDPTGFADLTSVAP